jgi:phosphatidylglycerol:prolipoprotein diacylglycerol transferase
MHPELFKIPFLNKAVYTYGALLSLGFIVGLWLAARNGHKDGLDRTRVFNLGVAIVIGSVLGAKLLMVVTEWNLYQGNVRAMLRFDLLRSGGVFYGGFIGAVVTAVMMVRRYDLPFWQTADAFAPGVALGQTIGRLGCFSAGCCWGKPTTSWLGVQFPETAHRFVGTPTDVHVHPTQLYESAATLVIFLLLIKLRKNRPFTGSVMLIYAMLYGGARFAIEFLRDDFRGAVGPLSTSQLIALVLIIGASYLYYRFMPSRRILNAGVNPPEFIK